MPGLINGIDGYTLAALHGSRGSRWPYVGLFTDIPSWARTSADVWPPETDRKA